MAKVPTPTYGADAAGLICGYRITPHAGTTAIDSAAAVVWLAQPREPDGAFLWLHFNLAHIATSRSSPATSRRCGATWRSAS